jgi:hypothetical protein
MRELTVEELDLELAEQLPSRELMSSAPCYDPCRPKVWCCVQVICIKAEVGIL